MLENTSSETLFTAVKFYNNSLTILELGKQLLAYKTSDFIFTYITVPIAVWGWIGNFLSFR